MKFIKCVCKWLYLLLLITAMMKPQTTSLADISALTRLCGECLTFTIGCAWRHSVTHFNMNLENSQRVCVSEENNALHRFHVESNATTTVFFNFPWKTVLSSKTGTGLQNRLEFRVGDAVGRIYTVHPHNFECLYLQLLIHNGVGLASFNE